MKSSAAKVRKCSTRFETCVGPEAQPIYVTPNGAPVGMFRCSDCCKKKAAAHRMMQSGYAFEFEGTRRWRASSDERWETVCYTPLGDERAVGSRTIDGAECVVFKCSDGIFRAQTAVAVRVASIVAAAFPWSDGTALAAREGR